MSTCRSTKPEPATGIPWVCGRSRGHAGRHWAIGISGMVLRRWNRKPVKA